MTLASMMMSLAPCCASRIPPLAFLESSVPFGVAGKGLLRRSSLCKPCSLRPAHSGPRHKSGLVVARASISSLYQAKGRSEESLKEVAELLSRKKFTLDVASLLALETRRKAASTQMDQAQQERNQKSKLIGQMKGRGEDTMQIMS